MKNWTFFRHLCLSVIVAILFNYIWFFFQAQEAASIGIIGGADGPTAIFISGNGGGASTLATGILALIFGAWPGLGAFGVMLLAYIPIKRILLR